MRRTLSFLRLPALASALAVAFTLGGCGSSDECGEDEVEVAYLGGSRDGETVCKPKPASCGDTASCGVQECIRDMYAFCESPYLGVGCSDTFAPPIISCNP
jgi:hypothetical protein